MHVLFRARVGDKLYYQDDQYLTSFLRRVIRDINYDNDIMSDHESYLPKPLEEYLEQWTGLTDRNGVKIFEGDMVYLAGYGEYHVTFPFIELYEAQFEGNIGSILK